MIADSFDDLQIFRNSIIGIDHKISENITIKHPTLGEICDFGEQKYYSMITSLCGDSSQNKVFLWDNGIDWTSVSEWDYFLITHNQYNIKDVGIVLKIGNWEKATLVKNAQNNEMVFGYIEDDKLNVVLDRMLWHETRTYLQKIHGFKDYDYAPANEYSKRKLVEKDRKRLKRLQESNEEHESMLKPLITALVNNQGFKYDYKTVWNIPVSALTESVEKIQKFVGYLQIMQGVYAGTVDIDKMKDKSCLNWLG